MSNTNFGLPFQTFFQAFNVLFHKQLRLLFTTSFYIFFIGALIYQLLNWSRLENICYNKTRPLEIWTPHFNNFFYEKQTKIRFNSIQKPFKLRAFPEQTL